MELEPALVEHCAPTLARLKAASLFTLVSPRWDRLYADAARLSRLLRARGLALRIVPIARRRALCYLYREALVQRMLCSEPEAAFLRRRGYRSLRVEDALCTLFARVARGGEFPHEIGLFLGYPLRDVIGFIEHGGRDCVCCGCWKCYGDASEAQRLFARYERCTRAYRRLYGAGVPLRALAVPASA